MNIINNIGEIETIEENSIILSDCLIAMKKIKSKSIDLILTDLPFGTTKCKWDIPIDLPQLWVEYNRIIKDNGAILLFAQTPFDKVLGSSNIKHLRYEWIWEKTHVTGHLNAKKMPMKAHENILVFYKKLPKYYPQKTTGHVRKVSTAHHKRNSKKTDIYNDFSNHIDYDSTERYPRSVLKFKSDRQINAKFSTQKPIKLLEYFIKTYSDENDLVLDSTMGSGSTIIASINLKRKFIGIELIKNNFNIAIERIKNETNI